MSTTVDALMIALLLTLPISALAARRLPIGSLARMALAWLAIFAAATLLVLAWRSLTQKADAGEAPVRTDVATGTITGAKLT